MHRRREQCSTPLPPLGGYDIPHGQKVWRRIRFGKSIVVPCLLIDMIPTGSVHSGTAHREAVVVQYAVLSHKHDGMVAGQAMLRCCALGVADDAGIIAAAVIVIFQVREQPSEVHLIVGRLIARNVNKLFLFNRDVSHFYAACCIDELSRGSIKGCEKIIGMDAVNLHDRLRGEQISPHAQKTLS